MNTASGGITYLRITQRGGSLTGYLQSLAISPQSANGYTVQRLNVAGSVSGHTIEFHTGGLFGGAPLEDGTWDNGRVVLEAPFNGFVTRFTFKRVTVDQWNRVAAQFIQHQAVKIMLTRLKSVYEDNRQEYLRIRSIMPQARAEIKSRKANAAVIASTVRQLQAEVAQGPPTPIDASGQSTISPSVPSGSPGDETVSPVESRIELENAQKDLADAQQTLIKLEQVVSQLDRREQVLHALLVNDAANIRKLSVEHN